MANFAEYDRYDALGLADLVARKEIGAAELLETAIARVERDNPRLNAVVHTLYDRAREAVAAGLPQGPFTGVPFMLKDLGAFQKDVPTSFGSRFFDGFIAQVDATITERYQAAGLVVLARTATPEFGLNASTEPARHGPTRNPWNTARTAGGSSGGAAAAVAARMLPAAHATDGGGSIRIPASCCGLFGLKPTRARNPSGPLVGEGWSGMSVGHTVTISVRDSAALLDATHGAAPGDPYPAPPVARPFLAEVGSDPGKLRIALVTVPPDGTPVHPDCVAAAESAARLCAGLGHVVEPATLPSVPPIFKGATGVIISANLRNALEQRGRALGRAPGPSDVERVTWRMAERGGQHTAVEYAAAIQTIHGIGRTIAPFFERYDVMISPTLAQPPVALGHLDMMLEDLDIFTERLAAFMPFTPLFNITGQPAASLPLHWNAEGLPIGVQFAGRYGDEATLFRLASQLEAAAPWRDKGPTV
ncbi:MAG TPA: amidase family protein [Stellaceae bacterium]|nr:amidase family protein [Stellaceae bacterium]